nr:c-type cytochrome biogenesis protein CcmI [uncultured Celeribacter sp.]
MAFWIIASALACLAVAPIAFALWRGRGVSEQTQDTADIELQVYRDQLRDVEKDLARGVLSEEDAKRARTEVSRRILDADKHREAASAKTRRGSWIAAIVVAALTIGGSVWLYYEIGTPQYEDLPLQKRIADAAETRATRPSQDEIETIRPPSPPVQEPDERLTELLTQLRTALEMRPDDLQGHILLARNEAAVGNYRRGYEAQQEVIRIKGPAASAEDYANLADMMILAAGGYVSPEAEDALTKALQRDPQNGTALYYSGLMFGQTGRPDMTFKLWQPLLASSDPTAPWVAPIRMQIEQVAQIAGIRYSLPPLGNAALPGPSQADVEAMADMSPEDRQEVIRGMVEGLSARLANEGGTPEEWSRLISSLAILGETQRATAIWGEAQVIFGADPAALATVRAGAERAGIVQ